MLLKFRKTIYLPPQSIRDILSKKNFYFMGSPTYVYVDEKLMRKRDDVNRTITSKKKKKKSMTNRSRCTRLTDNSLTAQTKMF